MKKILIITSHPSSKGFTHKIANAYKKANENRGNHVEILNLYDKNNMIDFLEFEDIKEMKISTKVKNIQNNISNSDEIVLISPIWWGDVNGIMKNFYDNVISSGFAFKYENGKAVGLLKGKTAKMFLTCDGPGFFYKFPFVTLKTLWKYGRLGFCGIKLTHFQVIDKMRLRDEKNRINLLNNISKLN